ncbi:MAG: DUF488 domain-containing protein [Chitinophagaceae bacterium]
MKPVINVKRVYEEPSKKDGLRVLVDRLWPRGLTKEAAGVDEWAKDIAPSTELRKWFGHTMELWDDFKKQYKAELKKNPAVEPFLQEHQHQHVITLLYGSRDEEHNHALVLQTYLEDLYKKM